MGAGGRGQLQGWRMGAFQNSTDLQRWGEEMVRKVGKQTAVVSKLETSLTEKHFFFFN